jgi:hypothetical protein
MIAVEVKVMGSKYTWEIIGIYGAPNEDMLTIERLESNTSPTRNLTKRSIIACDLNGGMKRGCGKNRTDFG